MTKKRAILGAVGGILGTVGAVMGICCAACAAKAAAQPVLLFAGERAVFWGYRIMAAAYGGAALLCLAAAVLLICAAREMTKKVETADEKRSDERQCVR